MILHLGVIDVGGYQNNETTGSVAEYLENKYHIMQNFYNLYRNEIIEILLNRVRGSLTDVLGGVPLNNIFFDITSEIQPLFQEMILMEKLNNVVPGVATQAAKDGVNHRKMLGITQKDLNLAIKNGTALVITGKRKIQKTFVPRPSFMDTHLYYSSFVAWIE